jgi:hypothetical protein
MLLAVYNMLSAKNHNILWFFFLDPQTMLHYTFPGLQISKYQDMGLMRGDPCLSGNYLDTLHFLFY